MRYCLFLFLLGFSYEGLCQKVIRNAEGEKIIQYEDGTWRYFEGRDSMLESDLWEDITSDKQKPIDPLPSNEPIQYDYLLFQKYIAAAVRYESEMLDKVDQSSNEAHSLEDKLLVVEDSGDPAQIEGVKMRLEALNDRRQNDQRLLSYARSLIKKILKVGKSEKYEKLAKIYVPGLNTDHELDGQDSLMVEAKTSDSKIKPANEDEEKGREQDTMKEMASDQGETTPDPNLVLLSEVEVKAGGEDPDRKEGSNSVIAEPGALVVEDTKVEEAIPEDMPLTLDSISVAKNDQEPDLNVTDPPQIEEIDHMIDTTHSMVSNELPTMEEYSKKREEYSSIDEVPVTTETNQDKDPIANEVEEIKTPVPGQINGIIANAGNTWFSSSDAIVPEYKCDFTFHGIDDFTNTMKKEMKEELFFSYTDERLKPYLKDNDYVLCKGYLTSISGGFRYLTLIFTIASKNASREYGYIKTGSLLNLKLLDGETVSLFTQSENQGVLDPKSGFTTYRVRYPIDYQKEKILQKSGVDKVRVVWSSGYEDYEVYNIDFFLNQLNCLNNK